MLSFLRHIWGSPFKRGKTETDSSYQDIGEAAYAEYEKNDDQLDDDNLVRNLIIRGNECFASGKYKRALETYFAAIQIINPAMKVVGKGTKSPSLIISSQYPSFNTLSIKGTKLTFHMVKVLVNISAVLVKTDRVKGALRILQESLKLSRLLVETFGASHQMNMGKRIFRNSSDDLIQFHFLYLYGDVLQNIGLAYIKKKNYELAQDNISQSIITRRSALKLFHERKTPLSDQDENSLRSSRYALAHTLQIYGWTCDQRGLFDESKLSYCEALNLRYDDEGNKLIPLLTAVADSYVKCYEFNDAEYSYQLIMDMIKQDKESIELIDITIKLSSVYQLQGKYVEAFQFACKAFVSATNLYDGDETLKCIVLSEAMSNLGLLYLQKGNFVLAKKWLKLALEERLQRLKIDDPLIMESIDSIARVYSSRKDFSRLIVIYTKCAEKFIQFFGENHRCVAKLTSKLGEAYSNTKNYDTALQIHDKARKRMLTSLAGEENHPDVACILRCTADTYCKAGRMDEGFDIFSEALNIFHKCGYTNSHPDVAETLQKIDAYFAEHR